MSEVPGELGVIELEDCYGNLRIPVYFLWVRFRGKTADERVIAGRELSPMRRTSTEAGIRLCLHLRLRSQGAKQPAVSRKSAQVSFLAGEQS